jgi:hypothetical protein
VFEVFGDGSIPATTADRMDTQAVIAILEDKRAEVMPHQEDGYFIHDWQELLRCDR